MLEFRSMEKKKGKMKIGRGKKVVSSKLHFTSVANWVTVRNSATFPPMGPPSTKSKQNQKKNHSQSRLNRRPTRLMWTPKPQSSFKLHQNNTDLHPKTSTTIAPHPTKHTPNPNPSISTQNTTATSKSGLTSETTPTSRKLRGSRAYRHANSTKPARNSCEVAEPPDVAGQ